MKIRWPSAKAWKWIISIIPACGLVICGVVYGTIHLHHRTRTDTATVNTLLGLSYLFLGLPQLVLSKQKLHEVYGVQGKGLKSARVMGGVYLCCFAVFAYGVGDTLNWW